MPSKRNLLQSSKSEKFTSAVANGGTKLLSKAASARKFGKNVLSRSRHDHDDLNANDDAGAIFASSMHDGENNEDFRWSIRPGLQKNIKVSSSGDISSDEEDEDGDSHHDDKDPNEKSSEMSSLEMAMGASSAHSKKSLELGTISEVEEDDGFATEAVGVEKKKKKKKTKKRADRSPKRDGSPKRDLSPKRKLNRTQSERTSEKLKSSSDPNGISRVGLSRSKSSQSERQVGTLDSNDHNDDLKVPRPTVGNSKSKKLKKGRAKQPMKIDFTGRVSDAANDEASEVNDGVEGGKPKPAKKAASEEKDDDSDSEVDPITKANLIATHLMRSTSQEYRSMLEEIEEKKPLDVPNQGKLEALLTSGRNTHVLGEEDSFFSRNSGARSSGQGHVRHSSNSRGSGVDRISRPSFSNKLRVSIFSDTNSFIDEWSSADDSQRKSLDAEKQRVAQLLDDLEKYEQELSQGHAASELEKEALEFELHKQTEKNQELEAMIEEMQSNIKELESTLKNQEDDQMLLVENEILKKRLEQKESAMLSMTSMHSLNNRSYSSDLPMVEEDDLNTYASMDTDGSDEDYEKPSAKMQGKMLQARAKLAEKDRTIQKQAEEIKRLQRECEDYKDDEAREKMKSYIEGLEKEKKFFVAEIAKLKEANEKAAMNSSQYSSAGDEEMSKEDNSFALWGSSQTFNRRGSTITQQSVNRRQSNSGWRSFSTILFGGVEEVDDAPPEVQSEAGKMLDDLTKDM